MQSEQTNRLNDEVFDLLLTQVLQQQEEARTDEVCAAYAQAPFFEASAGFAKKIEALAAGARKGSPRRFRLRAAPAIAAVAAILIFAAALPVGAYIENSYHFFFSNSEATRTVARSPDAYPRYLETLNQLGEEWGTLHIPVYNLTNKVIPSIEVKTGEATTLVVFQYDLLENYITFTQRRPTGDPTLAFDAERGMVEEIVIDGNPAFFWHSGEETYLSWRNGSTAFGVSTNMGREVAIAFAESLVAI